MAGLAQQAGQVLGLDRSGLAQGLRLALAAWLAFAIASVLQIGNAYWAAMPIWVVAQSSKGLLLERGFFRIVGTVLGAAFGFALLHLIGNAYAALALLGLWVALNAAATQMLRGVIGYGALMAGMTAAIVVLPSVLSPDHSLAIGLARVENTLIGVVVVTLVTGLSTPSSPWQDFDRRVRQLAADAVAFAMAERHELSPHDADRREQRLLLEIGQTQAEASRVTAGSVAGYRRLHHVDALIVAALAVMAAGRARRRGLDVMPGQAETTRLHHALARLAAAEAMLQATVPDADARSFGKKATYLAPHHDTRLAAEAGLAIGAATAMAAILGLVSGWGSGELAALGVCIFAMVLGSLPAPRVVAPLMLQGTLAGAAAAVFYRLLIQPHVTTAPELILSVAPFLLAGGLARASRKTTMPAIDANMAFLLASQAVLPAVTDHATILAQTLALLIAVVLVCTAVILLPSRRFRRVGRAVQAIRSDLRRMATDHMPVDPLAGEVRATRHILRLSLHLSQLTDLPKPPGFSLLTVLNLADSIARLQGEMARPDLDEAEHRGLKQARLALARMTDDPEAVADELDRLAANLRAAPAIAALRHLAADLRASRALLTLAVQSRPALSCGG